jgi:hypothetical protein
MVLPRLAGTGEAVFTDEHLGILFDLFDRRCGGSLASSSLVSPTGYGSYRPEPQSEPVKDFHTVLYIYTRPVDAADRFFGLLKSILKTAGLQKQGEVLVERIPAWMMAGAPLPRRRHNR